MRQSGPTARRKVVLLGAGGHGRVVLDALGLSGSFEAIGFLDADDASRTVDGVAVIGTDAALGTMRERGATHAIVTVGSIEPGPLREQLFERIRAAGLEGAIVIHRAAIVSPRAPVGEGTVVLAGCVVNPGARIGRNVIVNTGAILEHDVVIEDHAHISPGAILGGGVSVGRGAHVGIGATVIQGIKIGAGAFVAAGAAVVNDVPPGARFAGVPARPLA